MEKERSEHNRVLESDRAKYGKELEALKSSFEKTHRRLQNELDKTLFGHHLTVQTEFDAMKEIWQSIPKIREACYMIRACYALTPPPPVVDHEAVQRQYQTMYTKMTNLRNDLDVLAQGYGPFITPEIHLHVLQISEIARTDLIEAGLTDNRTSKEWSEAGKRTSFSLNAKTTELLKLIRARNEELSRLRSDGASQVG